MRAERFKESLKRLADALRQVEQDLAQIGSEADPLASHIYAARRSYRGARDTKSGKSRDLDARLSYETACELGYRGSLRDWEMLMGAVSKR